MTNYENIIDTQVKNDFCEFLRQRGFTDIKTTDEFDKYYYLDVIAKYNDKKYGFELKSRNFPHNKYGDIICEESKYNKALNDFNRNTYDTVFVCNSFTDNYWCLNEIRNYISKREMLCPKTTSFDNKDYVYKNILLYKQKHIFKRDEDGNYIKI